MTTELIGISLFNVLLISFYAGVNWQSTKTMKIKIDKLDAAVRNGMTEKISSVETSIAVIDERCKARAIELSVIHKEIGNLGG